MNFSVLMSVYHREQAIFLDKSLESILINQTLKPDEIVLVGDGELTDELYAIIEKYKKLFCNFLFIQIPENVGLGKALNEGLKHCRGEWIIRMDSDDIAMPMRLERQYNVINQDKTIDVVGAWVSEFDENIDNIFAIKKVPETNDEIHKFAQKRNPINHPVVAFRKNRILQVGGYEHCMYFEDYWLWVRLLNSGAVFYNIQEPLLWFRSNKEMYKRRGGIGYIKHEYRFQRKVLELGFISYRTFIVNMLTRTIVRVIPNELRSFFYQKFLR